MHDLDLTDPPHEPPDLDQRLAAYLAGELTLGEWCERDTPGETGTKTRGPGGKGSSLPCLCHREPGSSGERRPG